MRRRQEAIEKLAKEALALAGDRSFDRAVALVDSGLKNWTGEPRLAEVRASILAAKVAWQRAQALQAAIEQARGLGREKRYADALAHIAAALKEYKDDPTLLQLEKEYRLRQDVAQSRRLIEEGRPGEALGLLEKCAREAASDPEVNALIAKGACGHSRGRYRQAGEGSVAPSRPRKISTAPSPCWKRVYGNGPMQSPWANSSRLRAPKRRRGSGERQSRPRSLSARSWRRAASLRPRSSA